MTYDVCYVSGVWAIAMTFPTKQEYHRWNDGVRAIKQRIEAVNNDDNDDSGRVPQYRAWLDLVGQFVVLWGENFLPPDIKDAVNGVEGAIGVQPTVWADPPANHLARHWTRSFR